MQLRKYQSKRKRGKKRKSSEVDDANVDDANVADDTVAEGEEQFDITFDPGVAYFISYTPRARSKFWGVVRVGGQSWG